MTPLFRAFLLVVLMLIVAAVLGAMVALGIGWPFHHPGGRPAWAIPGAGIGLAMAIAFVFAVFRNIDIQ